MRRMRKNSIRRQARGAGIPTAHRKQFRKPKLLPSILMAAGKALYYDKKQGDGVVAFHFAQTGKSLGSGSSFDFI